jgi:predicted DCC family thiol-disulfide oxidoreductase YuxK
LIDNKKKYKEVHHSAGNDNTIVLFDGVCNFCNSSVNFIIDRDYKNRFRFAALQSAKGREFLKQFNLDTENLKTIILIENGKYYTKTTAALRIAKHLKGFWKLTYVFIISPPFIRNIAYNIIAKYRYKWFGKKETCRIPAPAEKEKFLE